MVLTDQVDSPLFFSLACHMLPMWMEAQKKKSTDETFSMSEDASGQRLG
jgi:hypothetical protein